MNINEFARNVTIEESGKQEVSIAQVKEILRIINKLTGGVLYLVIRLI